MMTWDAAPLGDLCTVTAGGTPARANAEFWGGTIPWVKISDMLSGIVSDTEEKISQKGLDNSAAKLLPKGTLLLSIFATIGRTALLNTEAATNQAIVGLIVKDPSRLHGGYLQHFLKLKGRDLEQQGRGVAQPNINGSILRSLTVPVPPLSEQHRIAAILDQAEALRAKRTETIAKLDKLAQSTFLETFGDPVTNPKGWNDARLGSVLSELQYGPRFYNESYVPDGVRIVRITDLNEAGELDFKSMPRLAIGEEDRVKYLLHPGDLIFARTGATVGKVALIQEGDPPCIAGAYFISMRFESAIDPAYARAVLTTPSIRAIVAKRSRQAAQQNFSGPALRQLPMPVPPTQLQKEFAESIQGVQRLKESLDRSRNALDSLFLSLQHRAFRGEL